MASTSLRNRSLTAAHARPGALARMIALLAAAILTLQLLCLTQHHHDLKRHFNDCASCVLAAQLTSPPDDPLIAEEPVRSAVLQYRLQAARLAHSDRSISKPIPRAQGPPLLFAA